MATQLKVISTNRLVNSPHYGTILREYNRQYDEKGKVQSKKFYNEVVAPLIPNYGLDAWYSFLRKFKTHVGLEMPDRVTKKPDLPKGDEVIEESNLKGELLSNQEATSRGINKALNAGSKYIDYLYGKFEKDPESLTTVEHKILSEYLFKAMKSQDSRIHALGKVREDAREEQKMERAFHNASYGNE